MHLFELPIIESGDLDLKACAFKSYFFVKILFYLNYSSLPVANRLYVYIIKYQYWKFKHQSFAVTVFNLQSSIIFNHLLKYLYMIRKQKWEKFFPFFSGLNMDFHGLRKKKILTFTFSDIVSIHPALFLGSFV